MVITGAAVCPGAPFLIAGVADSAAARMQPVVLSCVDAIRRLPAANSVVLLSTASAVSHGISPAPYRVLPAGSSISMSSLRRSDLLVPAIGLPAGPLWSGPPPTVTDPAVGTMVGAALLDSALCRLPVTVVEVGAPAATAEMLIAMMESPERVVLLVIADGSACHGDDAPGRRDDRATGFDAAVSVALAEASPAALASACADRRIASELLASVDPLAVLAELTAGKPPATAELLYAAAPLGVGYWVACWRWADR